MIGTLLKTYSGRTPSLEAKLVAASILQNGWDFGRHDTEVDVNRPDDFSHGL